MRTEAEIRRALEMALMAEPTTEQGAFAKIALVETLEWVLGQDGNVANCVASMEQKLKTVKRAQRQ